MNQPLGNFIKRFFSHYLPVQKGLSVSTILAYRDAVKLLLCHTADTIKIAVDQLAVENITESIVIVALELDDLRLGGSAQIRFLGKGRKERSCPLWPLMQ